MRSTSAILDEAFRANIIPALCRIGFEQVDERNGWAWRGNSVLVFKIRAVGRSFASVTGWSSASVGVSLGVFFEFAAPPGHVRRTEEGKALPAEYQCHMRGHLERTLNQPERLPHLTKAAERKRKDLWWIDPKGNNVEEVAIDIASQLESVGPKWYVENSSLETAFHIVEKERDCFSKFVMAAHLAQQIGAADKYDSFKRLSEKEGKRIGIKPDTDTWFRLAGR